MRDLEVVVRRRRCSLAIELALHGLGPLFPYTPQLGVQALGPDSADSLRVGFQLAFKTEYTYRAFLLEPKGITSIRKMLETISGLENMGAL